MDINTRIQRQLDKAKDAELRIHMALQEIKELAGIQEENNNGTISNINSTEPMANHIRGVQDRQQGRKD